MPRPSLAKFVICVERVLHHFIFFLCRGDANELAGVVTLLIWMKQAGLREQVGPSAALRELWLANLPRLSPMYAQNRAAVVYVDEDCHLRSEVLAPQEKAVAETVENFTREISQLVRFLKDEISLF